MIVALGKLALDADLGQGGIIDPMLRTHAARVFDAAPRGSALELRASLVLLALSCDALRGALLALAPAVGYDVGRLGGALYGAVEAMGGDPEQAAVAVLTMIKATRAPAPIAAPVASRRAAPIDDPYPGLRQRGLNWPEVAGMLAGDKTARADSVKAEWSAAGLAHERGEIASWVAEIGSKLGFTWEPVDGGA